MVELRTRKWEMRGVWGNHHEKLGHREFRVQGHGPFEERLVRVPIRRVITPIWGPLYSIWHGVHLLSHICCYPRYHSNLHPPSLFLVHNSTIITEHKLKSSLSISPFQYQVLALSTAYAEYSIHQVQHTPSTAYTEYSIHWVQHTPSTASTQDCLGFLQYLHYELRSECSFSFRCAALHHRPPSVRAQWELRGKTTLSDSDRCELTNRCIESQHLEGHASTTLQLLVQYRLVTTTQCIIQLHSSLPWSASPNSVDHELQLYLQTHSIPASKCISKVAQLCHRSVSQNLLNNSLRGHTIMGFKFLPILAQSRCPSSSLTSCDQNLQEFLPIC